MKREPPPSRQCKYKPRECPTHAQRLQSSTIFCPKYLIVMQYEEPSFCTSCGVSKSGGRNVMTQQGCRVVTLFEKPLRHVRFVQNGTSTCLFCYLQGSHVSMWYLHKISILNFFLGYFLGINLLSLVNPLPRLLLPKGGPTPLSPHYVLLPSPMLR